MLAGSERWQARWVTTNLIHFQLAVTVRVEYFEQKLDVLRLGGHGKLLGNAPVIRWFAL